MKSCPLLLLLLALAGTRLAAAEPFAQQLATLQARLALEPTNAALFVQLGDLCHDEGVHDNPKAVVLAEKYLNQALTLAPTNAFALALLGSTFTMKGRDAFWPGSRLGLVKEGNQKMDAAVLLAPEDFQVRFLRAINNFHMPKFLGREEIVQADFAWLWTRAATNTAPAALRQEIALHHGLVLKKHKRAAEAGPVWQAGVAVDPQSMLATELREQLEQLRAP